MHGLFQSTLQPLKPVLDMWTRYPAVILEYTLYMYRHKTDLCEYRWTFNRPGPNNAVSAKGTP